MATLYQKSKELLKEGELNSDVKGDVMVECMKVLADSPYCMGLGLGGTLNVVKRVIDLYCDTWKQLVKGSKYESEFNQKFKVLCINACHFERRNMAMSGVGNPYAIPDRWD